VTQLETLRGDERCHLYWWEWLLIAVFAIYLPLACCYCIVAVSYRDRLAMHTPENDKTVMALIVLACALPVIGLLVLLIYYAMKKRENKANDAEQAKRVAASKAPRDRLRGRPAIPSSSSVESRASISVTSSTSSTKKRGSSSNLTKYGSSSKVESEPGLPDRPPGRLVYPILVRPNGEKTEADDKYLVFNSLDDTTLTNLTQQLGLNPKTDILCFLDEEAETWAPWESDNDLDSLKAGVEFMIDRKTTLKTHKTHHKANVAAKMKGKKLSKTVTKSESKAPATKPSPCEKKERRPSRNLSESPNTPRKSKRPEGEEPAESVAVSVGDTGSDSDSDTASTNSESMTSDLGHDTMCKICGNPVVAVLLSCSHSGYCMPCSRNLNNKPCPECGKIVVGTINPF
jgi:Zinc finger, C3HC4 type (RING finger)